MNMKKVSLEISLELNAICPHCDNHNDLRERDYECDYFWSSRATDRLSGKHMDVKETHECYECGHVFEIDNFEIL